MQDKRDWQDLDREAGVKMEKKKNRLPAVPRWKMIPRFKTRVYVLFVFPALSLWRVSTVKGKPWFSIGKGKMEEAGFCEILLLFFGFIILKLVKI